MSDSKKQNLQKSKIISQAIQKKMGQKSNHVSHVSQNSVVRTDANGFKTIIQKNKRQIIELARIPPSNQGYDPSRPHHSLLRKFSGTNKKLALNRGAFNGSIVQIGDKYLCVYRKNEYVFGACYLDSKCDVIQDTIRDLNLEGDVADPRLIFVGSKLVLSFSRHNVISETEFIAGAVILDFDISDEIKIYDMFRISPIQLQDRQKNWMPFIYENELYFIADIHPHRIYKFDLNTKFCNLAYELNYRHAWFMNNQLRGNSNAVLLPDGNYLATFHTAQKVRNIHYYDNGAYIFEGKPPFKPIWFANKTFLPAEAAVENHFRKAGEIVCVFPVGMVLKDETLIISYGDNDSAVKILEISLQQIKSTMIRISL